MDKQEIQRRRSSTTSRLAALVAGQGGSVIRRHRNSSFQPGDEASLIPDNFSPSQRRLVKQQQKTWTCCGSAKLCKLLIFLAMAGIVYIVFTIFYTAMNTRDPCVVADENLAFVNSRSPNERNPKTLPKGWKAEVPKIIHQQWKKKDLPKGSKYNKWHDQWRKLFPEPEYQHILWTDESALKLIEEHYDWFLELYTTYKHGIQRADAARYFIMYHYGGLYADLDYEPLQNFWPHLAKDRVSLIESPYQYNEKVQNSLMSSPKNDPFWKLSFTMLVEAFSKPVLSATGPVFLDNVIKRNDHPIHALPCENFQRIPLGEHDKSPYLTLLHREVLGRIYPMKQCGDYTNLQNCQLGRHHNTASYLKDTGLLELLW
eukprot:CAMPEP_0203805676 /NCGR_PEP_ID=MMETSP0100_2-20121128/14375_1 /ASSEMBLY_ACC=CAM_ASM_000210 /TAXON_ID=96639 /ORGANISM=" , Strain NY0313808BC1" /LENGTH=371 /DNA_ID=CAMNT_0050714237 /DNA_START=398 /DNA_END=1510 /DNA_ORIENTATION=+